MACTAMGCLDIIWWFTVAIELRDRHYRRVSVSACDPALLTHAHSLIFRRKLRFG